MNESSRLKSIKERLYSELTNLELLLCPLTGSRSEEHIRKAIELLTAAWEEVLQAERLAI